MLFAHCADLGRDPGEITLSAHIRSKDPAKAAEEAAALGAEGLHLGIVYLAPPHTPAVLAPMAAALSKI